MFFQIYEQFIHLLKTEYYSQFPFLAEMDIVDNIRYFHKWLLHLVLTFSRNHYMIHFRFKLGLDYCQMYCSRAMFRQQEHAILPYQQANLAFLLNINFFNSK